MSTPVSVCPQSQIPKPQIRPVANFHPNVWGNQFMNYTPEDKVIHAYKEEQVDDLKKKVRTKLTATAIAAISPSQLLNFIDAVQRLGVAYHFEGEIEEALQQIYGSFLDNNDMDGDLYYTALRFRLLRQQGYNISCEIFNKFKDEKGSFKEALITDVQGMLGLYEAAHLRVRGEDILEEALAFTTIHLGSMIGHLEYPLVEQVAHALKRPIRKAMERLEARWYMSIYKPEDSYDGTLLKLAKLDFNLVQSLHKEELSNLTRWWKELDFSTKLSFARDRLVEGYFWILGVYFEPQYAWARQTLTKIFSMLSVIDDIYDAYGTLEELKHFTQAIERWDINNINHLPEYMKLLYVALMDVYKEIQDEMEKRGYQYRLHYAIEVMKNQVRAYLDEVKWFHEQYIPTMEEYMAVALPSSGYSMLITSSFIGMGEIVTKETLDWSMSKPMIITASNLLARLMNDVKSYKFEKTRGHTASAIGCYMKQYGISEDEVLNEFNDQMVKAWMDINQEFLKPTVVSLPLLTRPLNFSRVLNLVYEEGDEYTNVGKLMKDSIRSIL